jgi:large subunit ribosomal protein L10
VDKTQKTAFVEEVREGLEGAPLVILTDFIGSTVDEMNQFRRACTMAGIKFKVVKNTLAKRAVSGTGMEILSEHFKGNIGMFLSGEDPVGAAKLFKEQSKTNEKLEIRAGFFEGVALDPKETLAVAEMASKEELQVLLLRTLLAGPQQVMGIVQAPARDLLYLLQNYAVKLEEG